MKSNSTRYTISQKLNQITSLERHYVWRYRHIVDSSARAEDCPYAILCWKYGIAEVDVLKTELRRIRELTTEIEVLLEEEVRRANQSEPI